MFLGSVMGSEKTAAAAGTVGELRFDPFAMLPFRGYNMADYFAHWLEDRAHRRGQAAEDLLRQLVPQGRRRALPVARLRRELARALVGVRPLRRPRRRPGDADRAAARRSARRASTPRPGGHRRGHGRAAARRQGRVARPAAPVPRALRALRGTFPRSCTPSCARSRSGSASSRCHSWPWASPAAAGGRDSSASEVIVESAPGGGLEHLRGLLQRARVELHQQVHDDARVVLVLVEAHVGEELAHAVVAEGGVGERVAGLRARSSSRRRRRRP